MSTPDELKTERSDLTRKLAVRQRTTGYSDNCEQIRARLEAIEAELNPPAPPEEEIPPPT